MSDMIEVAVVRTEPTMEPILNKIKHWHYIDRYAQRYIQHVHKKTNLSSALDFVLKIPSHSILVLIGFKDSDLTPSDKQRLEIIIRPPRSSCRIEPEIDEQPSASLLENKHVVTVQDSLPALRKSMLRLQFKNRVTVRELSSKEDFIQYFSLRYKVWREKNYLSERSNCEKSSLEVHYSDHFAYPIGAFSSDGELVGCARLVFPAGCESHHCLLINKLVSETGDKQLIKNFAYPSGMMHPFDILESMAEFGRYYRNLCKRNTKYAEVSRVIVAPTYRSEGLGEILVDSTVSLARRKRLDLLFLACHQNLQPFYERSFFKALPDFKCDQFAGVNAPAIAMELKLCL